MSVALYSSSCGYYNGREYTTGNGGGETCYECCDNSGCKSSCGSDSRSSTNGCDVTIWYRSYTFCNQDKSVGGCEFFYTQAGSRDVYKFSSVCSGYRISSGSSYETGGAYECQTQTFSDTSSSQKDGLAQCNAARANAKTGLRDCVGGSEDCC